MDEVFEGPSNVPQMTINKSVLGSPKEKTIVIDESKQLDYIPRI